MINTKFKVLSELSYEVYSPTTFIFNIQALDSATQIITEENLVTNPNLKWEACSATPAAGRFIKIFVAEKMNFTVRYTAIADTRYTLYNQELLAIPVAINQLPATHFTYLYPSRYCQSDKLEKLAEKEFGHYEKIYDKVAAINEWIYHNIEYLGGFTNSNTSAMDTLTERVGVCRDFAHLGIALCRALSIPARYFTGYATNLFPPDFHACFEAFIGGQWLFFDPTKLVAANGLVKIAHGRDAADASVATIFGNAFCSSIKVSCESVDEKFVPYFMFNTATQPALAYQ